MDFHSLLHQIKESEGLQDPIATYGHLLIPFLLEEEFFPRTPTTFPLLVSDRDWERVRKDPWIYIRDPEGGGNYLRFIPERMFPDKTLKGAVEHRSPFREGMVFFSSESPDPQYLTSEGPRSLSKTLTPSPWYRHTTPVQKSLQRLLEACETGFRVPKTTAAYLLGSCPDDQP